MTEPTPLKAIVQDVEKEMLDEVTENIKKKLLAKRRELQNALN